MRRIDLRVCQLVGVVLSALLTGFLGFVHLEKQDAVYLIKHYEYWILFLSVGLFLWFLWCECRTTFESCAHLKKAVFLNWRPIVFVLGVACLVLNIQEQEFKIVMDEPVLMATALQMHEEAESLTAARAYEVNGSDILLGGYVDKRPSVFPFIVSLMHSLTGYRPSQGFILNAWLTPICFGLLYRIGGLLWPKVGGYLSVGLCATVPLFAMNATGAGFELLNLTLLLGCFLLGYYLLRAFTTDRMNLFVLTGVLLAQTRYESALFIFAVAAVLLRVWWGRRSLELSWTMVFVPWLLLSVPLRRTIHWDNSELWQLGDTGATEPFSAEFVVGNLQHALRYFFSLNETQPNSLWLSVLFAIAILILPCLILVKRVRVDWSHPLMFASIMFGAVILTNFVILMAYHWGQIDDILATRIALPMILLQVLLVVAVASVYRQFKHLGNALGILTILFFLLVTRPMCARTNFLKNIPMQHQVVWLANYLESRSDKNILFITDRHMMPLIYEQGVLTVESAVRTKFRILLQLKLRTFDEILAVYFEPYRPDSMPLDQAAMRGLEGNFILEPVVTEKLNSYGIMHVARVRDIKADAASYSKNLKHIAEGFQEGSTLDEFSKNLP